MSRFNIRTSLAVVGAAALLVAGTDLVAYAATGSSLVIGQINKANGPTTISNTGKGPALVLKNRAASPPLKVSSGKKVAKLNADRVDGLDSKTLEPGVIRVVLARQGETLTNLSWKAFRVPRGSYLVTLNGMVSNPNSSSDGWFTCVLADAERTFRPNADPNMGGIMAGAQADFSKDVSDGVFGMSNVYTIAARHRVAYACQGGAGTGSVKAQAPITATLRKVNRPATKVGTKYTPPPNELKGGLRNLLD